MCGYEASHARSVLVTSNSSHGTMSLPSKPDSIDPPWVSGDVKFGVDGKEFQILFEVQCILEPCQSIYIKGDGFVDARGDSKVVGGIAIWSKSRKRDRYVRRKAHTTAVKMWVWW